MREDAIRALLERLVKDSESNNNRKVLGIRSNDEYSIEKESLIEDAVVQISNLDISIEINRLKRGYKWGTSH